MKDINYIIRIIFLSETEGVINMEKKKVLTAVAVGAATMAAGVGADQAKADSVKVTKQVIGDETKITTTTTKTVDSQEQINQTKQKVSDQKKVTAQASSTVDKDSQQVSQDKSNVAHWESVKKDATPANISANKQAQASQQSKISADKSTISSQQKNVDSAQSQVNSAQSNLNDKKAEQSSAQTNYNNAQNDYNKAKQNADNIQSAISDQQSTVSKDKQNISDDNSQISGLNSSIANDKTAISDTQSAINNVSQKAQDDQAKLSRDENSLSDAQNQKTNDENKVNDIQNEINYMPVAPQLPSSFVNNIMKNPNSTANTPWDYHNGDFDSADNAMDQIVSINDPSLNYYVNAGNLSANDLKILNERLLAFLNQFRKQAGLAPLQYNLEAAQIAESVAHMIDNDDAYNTYDTNALNAVQNDYHLGSPSYGVSGGNTYASETHVTMNSLVNQEYENIYSTIVGDIQTDFGHMHALLDSGNALLGLAIDASGGLIYVNINLSDNPGTYGNTNRPQDPSMFEGKSEAVPDVSQLQSDLANAKQAVQNDNTAIQQLQNAVNADKAQLAQDTPSGLENQLSQQQAKLAQDTQSLQDAQNRLSMDEQKLTQDENTLSQLQQEANDPQKVLDTLANKVATAKTALDNANNAVAQAQQAYNTAEANFQKQQQILANDEAQLKADEAELAKLQQTGQDYAVAPQKLVNAQKQLAVDLAKYNQDHQTYLDDLQVLNELETELLNEEKTYTTTSVQWIKNSRPTTTSEIGNQFVLNSRSGDSMVKFNSMDEVQAAEVPGLRRSNRNNGLPDTGDNQNSSATVVGLLGLGLAGILNMFGLAERKKQN